MKRQKATVQLKNKKYPPEQQQKNKNRKNCTIKTEKSEKATKPEKKAHVLAPKAEDLIPF